MNESSGEHDMASRGAFGPRLPYTLFDCILNASADIGVLPWEFSEGPALQPENKMQPHCYSCRVGSQLIPHRSMFAHNTLNRDLHGVCPHVVLTGWAGNDQQCVELICLRSVSL